MPEIKLTKGKVTLVSEEDFEYLNQWKWWMDRYAARTAKREESGGKKRTILMHRFVVERVTGDPIPKGYEVDHIDGDPLNNQRVNLRLATSQQNKMNSRPQQKCSSRYKGASWDESNRKWRAAIYVNQCQLALGRFNTEEEAARAYDKAAREHFGKYAWLNFPEEQE